MRKVHEQTFWKRILEHPKAQLDKPQTYQWRIPAVRTLA